MNIFFHGTRSVIKSFTRKGRGKHGTGYYFTSDFNEARAFASLLVGAGEEAPPRVYRVSLNVNNPFDTMNVKHAEKVAEHFGLKFRVNKFAGGAKEHYHYLSNQLVKNGICGRDEVNEFIARAGFDAIYCDFFEHMIALESDQIEILSEELC